MRGKVAKLLNVREVALNVGAKDGVVEGMKFNVLNRNAGEILDTLRRTYISVALLANKFDVLWVMRQVGHADSKMTMDVYAQLRTEIFDKRFAKFALRKSIR